MSGVKLQLSSPVRFAKMVLADPITVMPQSMMFT